MPKVSLFETWGLSLAGRKQKLLPIRHWTAAPFIATSLELCASYPIQVLDSRYGASRGENRGQRAEGLGDRPSQSCTPPCPCESSVWVQVTAPNAFALSIPVYSRDYGDTDSLSTGHFGWIAVAAHKRLPNRVLEMVFLIRTDLLND